MTREKGTDAGDRMTGTKNNAPGRFLIPLPGYQTDALWLRDSNK